MLTRLRVRNFKRFSEIDIELGSVVVFIGPNNSGKTSALQALALWEAGLRRWTEKRGTRSVPEKRPGVTINRRDLVAVPVPDADLLWRSLHTRDIGQSNGKMVTSNVRIEVIVDGVNELMAWSCGLEFDYANAESIFCRPLRTAPDGAVRMVVPTMATGSRVVFLPPMSGLAANETRLDVGAVNVRIGEGRTAEVLRNLCYRVQAEQPAQWSNLCRHIEDQFGAYLDEPRYVEERGEIEMTYREGDVHLDLSSSGRGLQQVLLLLAYMYANPGAVLLLDEPDAHLEVLRQRQVYAMLSSVALANGNQVIAASHSEVVLNEAAQRNQAVAFVGRPHNIGDRGSQLLKALREIGYEDYLLAEQSGWVLYLEGSTDLAILQALARKLGHRRGEKALERPFVKYVGNVPAEVRNHFHGLREAVPNLAGVALFDRLEKGLPPDLGAQGMSWRRREIESYLCVREMFEQFVLTSGPLEKKGPLFGSADRDRAAAAMAAAIREIEQALGVLAHPSPWGPDLKVTDEFMDRVFERYYQKLGLPNLMPKGRYHELVECVPKDAIDPEVGEKLDAIAQTAERASGASLP